MFGSIDLNIDLQKFNIIRFESFYGTLMDRLFNHQFREIYVNLKPTYNTFIDIHGRRLSSINPRGVNNIYTNLINNAIKRNYCYGYTD